MTQPGALDLNKGCSVRALTPPARQVHLAVMAAFAGTGRAPARGELERTARAHGADPAAVLAELAARDVIAFGADGEVRAAYPFSPVPTAIQVRWAGGPLTYAMCAIDALGISAMLGRPVTITAAEPGTGRLITVHAHRDQARWNPRRAVVFGGETGDRGGLSVDRTCGYINFLHQRPGCPGLGGPPPRRHRDGPQASLGAARGRGRVRGLPAHRRRDHPALTGPASRVSGAAGEPEAREPMPAHRTSHPLSRGFYARVSPAMDAGGRGLAQRGAMIDL